MEDINVTKRNVSLQKFKKTKILKLNDSIKQVLCMFGTASSIKPLHANQIFHRSRAIRK